MKPSPRVLRLTQTCIACALLTGCGVKGLLNLQMLESGTAIDYAIFFDNDACGTPVFASGQRATQSCDTTQGNVCPFVQGDFGAFNARQKLSFPVAPRLQGRVVRIELKVTDALGAERFWCACPTLPQSNTITAEIPVHLSLTQPTTCITNPLDNLIGTHLANGDTCTKNNQCASTHCVCADGSCNTRVCNAAPCPCQMNGDSTTPCGAAVVQDPLNCSGASHICHGGACVVDVGQPCETVRPCKFDKCRGDPTNTLHPGTCCDEQGPCAWQIDAGEDHTCAALGKDGARCWGNPNGQKLGDGGQATLPVFAPVVVAPSWPTGSSIVDVALGNQHSCALTSGATAWCWGANTLKQLGVAAPGGSNTPVAATLKTIGALDAGAVHNCAVLESNAVQCFGAENCGQLGNNNSDQCKPLSSQSSPLASPALAATTSATAIATGAYHSCAIVTNPDTEVHCWGANASGQLGNGSTDLLAVPWKVRDLPGTPVAIAAGGQHTCAIVKTDAYLGEVWCWGENANGQLGDEKSGTDAYGTNVSYSVAPVRAGVFTHADAITAGLSHTCAIEGEKVWCWGKNSSHQLGSVNPSSSPQQVSGFSNANIVVVRAGGTHTCAIDGAGNVWCWGSNSKGQLGIGDSQVAQQASPDLVGPWP